MDQRKWCVIKGLKPLVSYNVNALPDIPISLIRDTSIRETIPYVHDMVNVSAIIFDKEVTAVENIFYVKLQRIIYPACMLVSTVCC